MYTHITLLDEFGAQIKATAHIHRPVHTYIHICICMYIYAYINIHTHADLPDIFGAPTRFGTSIGVRRSPGTHSRDFSLNLLKCTSTMPLLPYATI